MVLIAAVLVAAWAASILVSRRRAATGHPGAGRWNAGLLLVTLLVSMATCSAPIVALVSGFQSVAEIPAAEKSAALDDVIDGARPVMGLALLSIPLVALGLLQHARNRRRIAEAKASAERADVF